MPDLATTLDECEVEFALIGGFALGPRGFPRGTTDIDSLIHEKMISQVRDIMRKRDAHIITEAEEFSSYDDGKIRVAFQHARRQISQAMLARAERIDFARSSIPVIQTEDLVGLKVQAYDNNPKRLQNRIDIHALISANWDTIDLIRVRSYYGLFDREKDLDDKLRLVSEDRR